jgi:hypothetical protein
MRILGAEVVPVAAGTATLKDAMNEAMRFWVSSVRDTFYVIGTTAGPHPTGDGPGLSECHRPGGQTADPQEGGAAP